MVYLKKEDIQVQANFEQEEGMEAETTSGLWEAGLQQLPQQQ